jgi:hypothetical protein
MSVLSPDEKEIFEVGKTSIPKFFFQKDEAPSEPLAAAAKAYALAKAQITDWWSQSFIKTATGFWLDQHARDRGTRRQANESDATLRARLRQIEDAVTLPALQAAVAAVLTAAGVVGSATFVENHLSHAFGHSTGSPSAYRSFYGRGERYGGGAAYPGSGTRLVIIILPFGTPTSVRDAIRDACLRKKGAGYCVTTETPGVTTAERVSVTPPSRFALTAGSAVAFAAQQSAAGSVTWAVDGIVGGNATVGTIVAGSYTPPATMPASGTDHEITATVGAVVGRARVRLT